MADITITPQERRLAIEALWQIEALLETLPPAMKGLDKFSLIQAVVVRVQQLSGIVGNVLDGDAGDEDTRFSMVWPRSRAASMRADGSPGRRPAPRHSLAVDPQPTAKQRAILLGMSPSERIALRLCILAEPGDTAAERTASGLCLRWMDAIEAEELERLLCPMSAALAASVIRQSQCRAPAGGAS